MGMSRTKLAKAVTLKVGKQIIPQLNEDCYKLIIDNMHGDADGTTYTESYYTESELPMLRDILLLLEDASHWLLGRDDVTERLQKIYKDHVPDEDENGDYHWDWAHELVDNDHTCDNQYKCLPTLHSLTYFDGQGVEYSVKLKYDYESK